MNTLEILHDQRKAVQSRIAALQEDLGDIQAAIQAVEGRKGSRESSQPALSSAPKPILASAMRPRAAATHG